MSGLVRMHSSGHLVRPPTRQRRSRAGRLWPLTASCCAFLVIWTPPVLFWLAIANFYVLSEGSLEDYIWYFAPYLVPWTVFVGGLCGMLGLGIHRQSRRLITISSIPLVLIGTFYAMMLLKGRLS